MRTDEVTTASRPIEPNWKVSQVIARYPALIDELVGLSPTFRMLRNPVMRRVQSRLVTVAQAAEIAGLAPDALIQTLNRAAGLSGSVLNGRPTATPESVDAAPSWVATAPLDETIDVRPLQVAGQEPFSAIMAAAHRVLPGRAFLLVNTFEPVPLYDVLGRRGFVHWAARRGPEEWVIRFFHADAPGPSTGDGASSATPDERGDGLPWQSPSATLTIDVSELVPPEPMVRILEALESLPDGATLLVHHVRRPMHLYPRLDALGYRHETHEPAPDRVEVLIVKTAPGDDR